MLLFDIPKLKFKEFQNALQEKLVDPVKEVFVSETEQQENILIANQIAEEVKGIVLPRLLQRKQELQSLYQSATDPQIKSGIANDIRDYDEYINRTENLTGETLFRNAALYNVESKDPQKIAEEYLEMLQLPKKVENPDYEPYDYSATNKRMNAQSKSKNIYKSRAEIDTNLSTPAPSEPEPEPAAAAKPAATAGVGQTGRVTAAMKPAEFKPKYLEEIEPKSEEEYLGKDPNNWKTMSKAEKAAKAIGFIGDIGGDVIDTIAAGYGLENGGAKRLREAREKLQRDKEERQAQYRDYVNKIEAENRRIREFNAGIGNQLAFQQFQAENEYNRQLNLLNEQARLQRENGLYNTPL